MWITQAWLHLHCLDIWKIIFQGNEMAQFSQTENSTSYTWGRQFYLLHSPSNCFCFLHCPHLCTTPKCLKISSKSWFHCSSMLITSHMHWSSTTLKAPFPLEVRGYGNLSPGLWRNLLIYKWNTAGLSHKWSLVHQEWRRADRKAPTSSLFIPLGGARAEILGRLSCNRASHCSLITEGLLPSAPACPSPAVKKSPPLPLPPPAAFVCSSTESSKDIHLRLFWWLTGPARFLSLPW